jgi:hypothetical protein
MPVTLKPTARALLRGQVLAELSGIGDIYIAASANQWGTALASVPGPGCLRTAGPLYRCRAAPANLGGSASHAKARCQRADTPSLSPPRIRADMQQPLVNVDANQTVACKDARMSEPLEDVIRGFVQSDREPGRRTSGSHAGVSGAATRE